MNNNDKPLWLKSKGYLHITAQLDVEKRSRELMAKVKNETFVSKYAFFPLLHANINERKFKKIVGYKTERAHSYMDENGQYKKNTKVRPLHYATHLDALIFGYYAEILQKKYELEISKHQGLSDCIIAYRKIPIVDAEHKHKSTIHFANEIFKEIQHRSNLNETSVLTFDIKSFFSSLNHQRLKNCWSELLCLERLPPDHYNVFKASTNFSYILLDDLKGKISNKNRKGGFNEKELARIRNKFGIHALFESTKDFRDKIRTGKIKLHKYPFRNKITKQPIGIPQGLPISAILANLYLFKFDLLILEEAVKKLGAYYRRYSDDIVIVCDKAHCDIIEELIKTKMLENDVEISPSKTEKFLFKEMVFGNKQPRLTCVKIIDGKDEIVAPFNYLGFEYNGQNAFIKSANIAKFYRRMISAVKSKAKRALKISERNYGEKPIIFRRQLYKLYTTKPLRDVKVRSRWKRIIPNVNGGFRLITGVKKKILRANYFSYVDRASEIMQEPAIKKQIRNHKRIFNQAINKHLR